MLTRPRSRRPFPGSRAGFTLMEIGIAIACIAALSLVVIMSKGHLTAAKRQSTITMVETIRTAAKQYAARTFNGVMYGNGGTSDVSISNLQAQNLLPNPLKTPWGATSGMSVGAYSAGACAGNICIQIVLPIGDTTTCSDLGGTEGYYSDKAVSFSCVGNTLTLVFR